VTPPPPDEPQAHDAAVDDFDHIDARDDASAGAPSFEADEDERGAPDGAAGDGLGALLDFVKRSRRFDFSGYKRSSLQRRIAKRMQETGCDDYASYQDYLEVHPDEFVQFFDTLLINVTSFFRDPIAWDFVAEEIVPRIISGKGPGAPIRVWSAGCATGEEAYTVAMVLADALGAEQFRERVKIYGTDVDEAALIRARMAVYSAKELEAVATRLVHEYFEPIDGSYTFRKDLRRSIIFGRHDLVQDAPISRLDLLVCRNTLMYFNAETQSAVLQRFSFALQDSGFLFLGKAETLLTRSSLFRPVDLRLRVFQKRDNGNARPRVPSLAVTTSEGGAERSAERATVRDAAVDEVPVPMLVVDVNGTLAMVNERARALFGVTRRDVGAPLQNLEASYRPVELRAVIEEAYAQQRMVQRKLVPWRAQDGERYYDVEVTPLTDSGGATVGAAITFTDVTQYRQLQTELEYSNRELETAYEELQSTNEELETTNEELQSTVEELETTNEELQSTNEELETMNEELQSTNDELQYVNNETQRRGEELAGLNNLFRAIMASLDQAVAVLDRQLLVQVWNARAEDLWGLRADEVVGESFPGLDIGLPVDRLYAAIRACLEGDDTQESLVLDGHDRRGRDVRCRVRCAPFRLDGPGADGVVVITEVERAT
jgi:two-component system CheB/CheR fusion protein